MCESPKPFQEFECIILFPRLTIIQVLTELFQGPIIQELSIRLSEPVRNSGVRDMKVFFTYGDSNLAR